jgi:hypothetical protein
VKLNLSPSLERTSQERNGASFFSSEDILDQAPHGATFRVALTFRSDRLSGRVECYLQQQSGKVVNILRLVINI